MKYGYLRTNESPAFQARLEPGEILTNPSEKPPWMVVDPEPISFYTHKPYRMFYVELLSLISDQAQIASQGHLPIGAKYKRAKAVRLIEEVDIRGRYGARGPYVCEVLAPIATQSASQAVALTSLITPDFGARLQHVYRQVRQLFQSVPADQQPRHFPEASPTFVHYDAKMMVNDRAFMVWDSNCWLAYDDEPDDGELIWPWSDLHLAFEGAALSAGTGDGLDPDDRAFIEKPWRDVFGSIPRPSEATGVDE